MSRSPHYNATMQKPPKRQGRDAYHHGHLRDAVLQQALKLIRKRGDVNFSLREVAQAVGVSHAAVYRHFRNKGDLLATVATAGFDQLGQSIEAAGTGSDKSPDERLAKQGAAYIQLAIQRPGHFTAMFAPEIQSSDQAVQVQTAADKAYGCLAETVAKKLGTTDLQDPRVHLHSLHYWALIHGLACLHLSGNLSACFGERFSLESPADVQALLSDILGER